MKKETFKLKVSSLVEREVEIELPDYRKSNCHFWKVFSEKTAIQITELGISNGINETYASIAYARGCEDSTKEEFEEAYDRISEILNDIKNQ